MLAGSLVLVVGVGGLWYYRTRATPWRGGHTPEPPVALTGQLNTEDKKPALKSPGDSAAAKERAAEKRPVQAEEPKAPAASRVIPPAPTPTPLPPALASRPAEGTDVSQTQAVYQNGVKARERGDVLAARRQLNQALQMGLTGSEAVAARQALAEIAQQTLFSRGVTQGDPLAEYYVVRSGDALGKIARRFRIPEELLAEINTLPNRNLIRMGQRLKVVHGPFHAALSKSEHVMHVYLQDTYVRTFRVALGANGGTPIGLWRALNRQKDPDWTDPRTGRKWHQDDPKNPIGEYWIGLEGLEGDAVGQVGFGIHGTIEPETIGEDVSLGCIRLADEDIKAVFHMLSPGHSLVRIADGRAKSGQ